MILYAFYANHLSSASKTRQGKQNLKVTSVLCVTSNALYMYMFHGKCEQALICLLSINFQFLVLTTKTPFVYATLYYRILKKSLEVDETSPSESASASCVYDVITIMPYNSNSWNVTRMETKNLLHKNDLSRLMRKQTIYIRNQRRRSAPLFSPYG